MEDCTQDIARLFVIRGGKQGIDASCAAELELAPFVTEFPGLGQFLNNG